MDDGYGQMEYVMANEFWKQLQEDPEPPSDPEGYSPEAPSYYAEKADTPVATGPTGSSYAQPATQPASSDGFSFVKPQWHTQKYWDNYVRGYWEDPQRVARWKQVKDAQPFDTEQERAAAMPPWYNDMQMERAYSEISQHNQGKPWWLWKPLPYEHPMSLELLNTPLPPKDPWAMTRDTFPDGRIPLDQIRSAWQQPYQAIDPEEIPNPAFGGMTDKEYDALPTWQKAMQGLLTAGGGLVQPAVLGGVMGGVMGGPFGAVAGAGLGTALGFGAQLQIPILQDLLMALDIPANELEKALGTAEMVYNAWRYPEEGPDLEVILANLPQAYLANQLYYESGAASAPVPDPFYAVESLVNEIKAGEISKDDVIGQLKHILPLMFTGSALASGIYNYASVAEQMWKGNIKSDTDLLEYIAGPGEEWFLGEAKPQEVLTGNELIVSVFNELMNNPDASIEEIMERAMYLDGKLNLNAMTRDLAGHILLDPLEAIGPAIRGGVSIGAKVTGNVPLQIATKMGGGLPRIGQAYGTILRRAYAAEDVANMGTVARWLGDVTKEGVARTVNIRGTPSNKAVHAVSWLFQMTPKARAAEVLNHSAELLMRLLSDADNETEMVQILNKLANTPDALAREKSMRSILAPDAAAIPKALKDFEKKAVQITDDYLAYGWNREMLQNIAQVLDDDVVNILKQVGGEATDMDVLFETIRRTAAESDSAASKAITSYIDEGIITPENLKQKLNPFIKKEIGAAINLDHHKANMMAAVMEHMDEWAVKWFNVEKDPGWVRLSNTMKAAQSSLLLGFNPTYAFNNIIDNTVTSISEGVFGLNTPKYLQETWDNLLGKDMRPVRYAEGVGPYATGVQVNYEHLQKAGEVKGFLKKINDVLKSDSFSKLQFAQRLSAKMEAHASSQAYTVGARSMYNKLWKKAVGYEDMPPALQKMLHDLDPNLPNMIHDIIQSGVSQADIEKKLWTTVRRRGMSHVMDDLIETANAQGANMTKEIAQDMFTKLGVDDFLDKRLPDAVSPEQVSRVFDDLEEFIESKVDDYVTRDMEAVTQQAAHAASPNGEALAGVINMWDTMQENFTERWLAGYSNWEAAFLAGEKLSFDARSALYQSTRVKETNAWNRYYRKEQAYYTGIAKGLGLESEQSRQVLDLVKQRMDINASFFKEKQLLLDEFWGKQYKNKMERNKAWTETQKAINELGETRMTQEFDAMTALDEYFVDRVGDAFGENGKAAANRWREGVREVVAEMNDDMRKLQDRLTSLKGRARHDAWRAFLSAGGGYHEKILKRFETNIHGVREMIREIFGDQPPPEQPKPGGPEGQPPLPGMEGPEPAPVPVGPEPVVGAPAAAAAVDIPPAPETPAPEVIGTRADAIAKLREQELIEIRNRNSLRLAEDNLNAAIDSGSKAELADALDEIERVHSAMGGHLAPELDDLWRAAYEAYEREQVAETRKVAQEFGVATAKEDGSIKPGSDAKIYGIIKKYGPHLDDPDLRAEALDVSRTQDITPELAREVFEKRAEIEEAGGLTFEQELAPLPELTPEQLEVENQVLDASQPLGSIENEVVRGVMEEELYRMLEEIEEGLPAQDLYVEGRYDTTIPKTYPVWYETFKQSYYNNKGKPDVKPIRSKKWAIVGALKDMIEGDAVDVAITRALRDQAWEHAKNRNELRLAIGLDFSEDLFRSELSNIEKQLRDPRIILTEGGLEKMADNLTRIEEMLPPNASQDLIDDYLAVQARHADLRYPQARVLPEIEDVVVPNGPEIANHVRQITNIEDASTGSQGYRNGVIGPNVLYQPGSPQHLTWFGDSQVLDARGNPQHLYHATTAAQDFDVFSVGDVGFHFGTIDAANDRLAFMGAVDQEHARVIPVTMKIENPIELSDTNWTAAGILEDMEKRGYIDFEEHNRLYNEVEGLYPYMKYDEVLHQGVSRWTWLDYNDRIDALQRRWMANKLQEMGYDGIKYRNEVEGVQVNVVGPEMYPYSWVAFNSNQIKSIWNNNNYSDGPSILYQGQYPTNSWENAALMIFGETWDPREAGYILDDGTLLDLSGKNQGGSPGYRAFDHRDIARAMDPQYLPEELGKDYFIQEARDGTYRVIDNSNMDEIEIFDDAGEARNLINELQADIPDIPRAKNVYNSPTDVMVEFMRETGSVRMNLSNQGGSLSLDINGPLTRAQIRKIKEVANWGGAGVAVDLSAEGVLTESRVYNSFGWEEMQDLNQAMREVYGDNASVLFQDPKQLSMFPEEKPQLELKMQEGKGGEFKPTEDLQPVMPGMEDAMKSQLKMKGARNVGSTEVGGPLFGAENMNGSAVGMTRRMVQEDLVRFFNLTPVEAETVTSIIDARATTWANRGGGTVADYYKTHFAEITDQAPSRSNLYQRTPDDAYLKGTTHVSQVANTPQSIEELVSQIQNTGTRVTPEQARALGILVESVAEAAGIDPDVFVANNFKGVRRSDYNLTSSEAVYKHAGADFDNIALDEYIAQVHGEDSDTYFNDVVDYLFKSSRQKEIIDPNTGLAKIDPVTGKKVMGYDAIHTNTKTLLALDVSADCTFRQNGTPCLYCYVENPRSAEKLFGKKGPQNANMVYDNAKYDSTMITEMPDDLVNYLNASGGLRVFSVGDFNASDIATLDLAVADAAQRGLKIKMITKQKDALTRFKDYDHVYFNLSTEFAPGHAAAIMEFSETQMIKAFRETQRSLGKTEAEIREMMPQIRQQAKKFSQKGQAVLEEGRGLVGYGWDIDEAAALAKNNDRIAVRYVAMNAEDAARAVMDDRFDVVTLYHGKTNPEFFKAIWDEQNPYLKDLLGPDAIEAMASIFKPRTPDELMNYVDSSRLKKLLGEDVDLMEFQEKAWSKMCCTTGRCGTCGVCCGFARGDGGQIINQVLNGVNRTAVEFSSDGGAIIHAFSDSATVSDFANSLAPVFIKYLTPDDDLILRDAVKLAADEQWTPEAHHKVGNMFENYLRSRMHGSKSTWPIHLEKLEPVFQKFNEWAHRIYWKIKVPLSQYGSQYRPNAAVKGVFDRMLGNVEPNTLYKTNYDQVMGNTARGAVTFLEDSRAIIHAMNNPDITTVVHELGHIFRRDLDGNDLAIAEKWAGVNDSQWTVRSEEKFAQGFERYLQDGKAPTAELAGVFDRLKEWITQIYSRIKGDLVDIDPEIRGVYDRLLAEQPDIDSYNIKTEQGRAKVIGPDVRKENFFNWFGDSKAVDANGEPLKLYHGTWRTTPEGGAFDVFKPEARGADPEKGWIYFTDDPEYANNMVGTEYTKGNRIYPVNLKMENPVDLRDLPWEHDTHAESFHAVTKMLKEKYPGVLNLSDADIADLYNKIYGSIRPEREAVPTFHTMKILNRHLNITPRAKAAGYDGFIFPDEVKNLATTATDIPLGRNIQALSYVAFEDTQVKSIYNGGLYDPENPSILYQMEDGRQMNLPQEEPGPPMNLPPGSIEDMNESAPMGPMAAQGWETMLKPMLDGARERLMSDDTLVPSHVANIPEALPPNTMRDLRAWLGKVYGQQGDVKLASSRWGENRRDAALLNYNKRYNFDNVLQTIAPYQFWYTRSMMKWALRGLDKPSIFANYARLRAAQTKAKAAPGFPKRLENKMRVLLPFMPDWMGGGVYVDPLRKAFPFTQIARPYEALAEEQNMITKRTEGIIRAKMEDGDITPEDGADALRNRAGGIWDQAYSKATLDVEPEITNPMEFARVLFGWSLTLSWAYEVYKGHPENIGQLPISRTIQNITGMLGGAMGGSNKGINIEAPVRKALGLPEQDQWQDYRIDRELSNMAAEGWNSEDLKRAHIEKTGPAFEEAERRVAATGQIRWLGAPIGLDIFPEGEQKQRGLKNEYDRAMEAWVDGGEDYANTIGAFFDKYPEYEVRMQSFKEDPEERLRAFMRSNIWDAYNNKLSALEKKEVTNKLGPVFQDAFLNKETRSYDSIDTATLGLWSKVMGEYVPTTAPEVPQVEYDFAPPEINEGYQAYMDEKNTEFPHMSRMWDMLYSLPEKQRDQIREQIPMLDDYYNWQSMYLADNPDIIEYVLNEGAKMKGAPPEAQALYYQYRSEVIQNFGDDIYDVQSGYFEQPNRSSKKKYLKDYPQLIEYWDHKDSFLSMYPDMIPYLKSPESIAEDVLGRNYEKKVQVDLEKMPVSLVRSLMGYYYSGEDLSNGARVAIRQMWEEMGRPGGSLDEFINEVMAEQFLTFSLQ